MTTPDELAQAEARAEEATATADLWDLFPLVASQVPAEHWADLPTLVKCEVGALTALRDQFGRIDVGQAAHVVQRVIEKYPSITVPPKRPPTSDWVRPSRARWQPGRKALWHR